MIYILTGDDIVSSRNKLTELIGEEKNVVRIDGKKQSLAEIDMALESDSLFGDKRTVVIEYFSKVKPSERLIELALKFEKDPNTTVILWDEVDLSAKISSTLKSAKSFSFTFPKVYFAFLDGLSPTSKQSLTLLHELIKSTNPELLFYSMIKRIRQLLLIKTNVYAESIEFKNMQSWQIGKLRKQADFWTLEQLKQQFLALAELDELLKTSGLTMPLEKHLDIIMLSDLN